MKKFILALLALTIILSSCSIEKRIHTPGYHIKWNKSNQNSGRQKLASKNNENPPKENKILTVDIAENNYKKIESDMIASINSNEASLEFHSEIKAMLKNNEPCDILTLRDGSEISAKVVEITSNEIKYKKCDYQDGPLYTKLKSDVFMIKYSNGTKDVFSSKETSDSGVKSRLERLEEMDRNPTYTKTNGMAIAGFVLSVVGPIFVFEYFGISIIAAIGAIVFSYIGLFKIKNHPTRWKGRSLALAGIILAALTLLAFIVILFAVMLFLGTLF